MIQKLNKLQSFLYYLILLFLPTQLGKHFWPDFSYVQGIRVDYLSPTFYLTDILIIILFLLLASLLIIRSKIKPQRSKTKIKNQKYKTLAILGIIFFIFINIFYSRNPSAGIYGFIKLVEFIFFGVYTAKFIKNISVFKTISLLLSFGVIFESVLAIAQYFTQGSIGSVFYFLGERTFTSQTPGIANASLNGELMLRPYATFSHPNVLAGYLIIAGTMIISNLKYQISKTKKTIIKNCHCEEERRSNLKKIIFIVSLFLGSVALFLTMSRVAIAVWLGVLIIYFFIYLRKIKFHIGLLVVLVLIGSIGIILSSPIRFRFTNFNLSDESVVVREELMSNSLQMIKDNFIIGVGLNNFLPSLPHFQKTTNSIFYLQPVHNIYLLIFSQIGITGFIFFLWFMIKTFKNIQFQISNFKYPILTIVLILGLFDHYFLTIQQGQLLFFFVLGMCWTKVKISS